MNGGFTASNPLVYLIGGIFIIIIAAWLMGLPKFIIRSLRRLNATMEFADDWQALQPRLNAVIDAVLGRPPDAAGNGAIESMKSQLVFVQHELTRNGGGTLKSLVVDNHAEVMAGQQAIVADMRDRVTDMAAVIAPINEKLDLTVDPKILKKYGLSS